MTESKKLPSKIEENIQSLASDIYLQVEDKITALLTSYANDLEISPELIEQQPCFQQLSEKNQQLKELAEQSKESQNAAIKELATSNEKLQKKLALQTQEIENYNKLNSAKLTDTEQVLKEKLQENSYLNDEIKKLTKNYNENNQTLVKVQQNVKTLSTELSEKQAEYLNLSKNDKAKLATISVQNQQVSDLQLKYDQAASELEYLKAEQEQSLQSSNDLLSNEQKQAANLIKQRQVLENELAKKDEKIILLQSDNETLIHDAKLNKQLQERQTQAYQQLENENKKQSEKSQKLAQTNTELNRTINENSRQADEAKSQISQLQKSVETHEKSIEKANEVEKELVQKLANLEEKNSEQIIEQQKLVAGNQLLKDEQQESTEKLKISHQKLLDELTQKINEKIIALNDLQKRADSSEQAFTIKVSKQAQEILDQKEKLAQETQDHQALSDKLNNVANALNDAEQQVEQLEQSLKTEKSAALKNREMVQETKSKQELEYNKARETIKYLRDENTELNRKLEHQVNELEGKVTEYRLRFEYAQKQLTKMAK